MKKQQIKEFTSQGKALLLVGSLLVLIGITLQNFAIILPGVFIWIIIGSTFLMALRSPISDIRINMSISKEYVRNRGLIAVMVKITNSTNKNITFHINLLHSYHLSCIELPNIAHISVKKGETVKLNWLMLATQRGNALVGPIELIFTPMQSIFINKVIVDLKCPIKILPHRPRINVPWKIKKDLLLKMTNEFAFRMKGLGDEFFSLREYQPGDQLKHIHWYASARYEKLYTKEFEELKHLHFLIFMDLSNTMYGPKFDYALSSLAELSALIQGTQHDLAVIAYSDTVERFILPQVGKNELKLMLNLYDLEATATESNLHEAIKFAQKQKLFNSVAIILSDLEGDLVKKLYGIHLLNAMNCKIIFVNFSTMHFNILASKDWITENITTKQFLHVVSDIFPSIVRDEYEQRKKRLVNILRAVNGEYVSIDGYKDNLILALYRLMKKYTGIRKVSYAFMEEPH